MANPTVVSYTNAEVTEDSSTPNLTSFVTVKFSDVDSTSLTFTSAHRTGLSNKGVLAKLSESKIGTDFYVTYEYTVPNSATQFLGAGASVLDVFTITASDGANVVSQDVNVRITGINDTPVLTAPSATFNATEDAPSTYTKSALTASATDTDTGDLLRVASVTAISGGTPTLNQDGTVTFTPNANFNGSAKFSYTVTDGLATSNSVEALVSVAPASDADTVNTNTTLAANGLTNGNLKVGSGISGSNFVVATDAIDVPRVEIGLRADMRYTGQATRDTADATLFFVPKGNVLGTPNDNTSVSTDDSWARWNFTYSINADTAGMGGKIKDNVYSFVISKVGANNALSPLTSFTLEQALAAALSQTEAEGVQNGSLLQDSVNLKAVLGSSFNPSELATYQIAIVANSRVNGSEVLRDTIRVQVQNGAPVAVNDTLNATEDTALNITASRLLANDTDPDLVDTLSIGAVTAGTGGTPVLNTDGSVTFTPSANFNGVASFSYKATDGSAANALSNSATVTVNVAAVNDAPVAVADTLSASRNTAVTYTAAQLLGNDTDAENQALKIKSVTSGSGGTATLNTDGSVTFTPTTNFSGPASFSYTVVETTSPNAESAPATVTVNVNPPAVNTAPVVVTPSQIRVQEGDASTSTINLLSGATDAEGDALAISGLNVIVNGISNSALPAGMSLSGTILTFDTRDAAFNSLKQGQALDVRLTYNVVDGRGGVTPQSQSIVINGTNDNPVVSSALSSTATKGSAAYTLNLLSGASDPDGDMLTATNVSYAINGGTLSNSTPTGLSVSGNTLTINPSDDSFSNLYAGQSKEIVVNYRVQDSFGGYTSQTETLRINGSGTKPNIAPTVKYLQEYRTTEGADSYDLDLLRGAIDPDASGPLSVTNLRYSLVGSSTNTTSLAGFNLSAQGKVTINPSDPSFDSISSGSTRSILLSYLVSDGASATSQSQVVVITGTNDKPTVANPLTSTATKGASAYTVNLLEGASDVDLGDSLYVANVTYKVDGSSITNTPAGVSMSGSQLTINPSDAGFSNLYAGQSKTITVGYQVKDSFGAFVDQTESITINGSGSLPQAANHAPLLVDLPNGPLALLNGANSRPFNFSVADVDGNALTLSLTATNGVINGLIDADSVAPGIQLKGSASQINTALSTASFVSTQNSSVALTLSDGLATSSGTIKFSPPPAPGTEPNITPYGGVSINGLQEVGQILSANTSSLYDPNGIPTNSFNYQWLKDGQAIVGATRSSYQVVNADSGHDISVQVNYTDRLGYDESVISYKLTAFGGVTTVNQAPYGGVSINDAGIGAKIGNTLTAVTSQLVDPNGIDPNGIAANKAFSYQWFRDGQSIANATNSNYLVSSLDQGHNLSVNVSFVDLLANRENVNSYDLYAYL